MGINDLEGDGMQGELQHHHHVQQFGGIYQTNGPVVIKLGSAEKGLQNGAGAHDDGSEYNASEALCITLEGCQHDLATMSIPSNLHPLVVQQVGAGHDDVPGQVNDVVEDPVGWTPCIK